MFTLFAKIIKRIANFPKAIIFIFLSSAILSIYPINHLRWELQLQDALKGNEVQVDYDDIDSAFGGLGSLTIILQSEDSLANFTLAEDFAQTFEKNSQIHFIEYKADEEFFKKNRLLYASEGDLDSVIQYVEAIRQREVNSRNPLLVDLLDTAEVAEGDSTEEAAIPRDTVNIVEQIEQKYFANLQQSFANADGTIRVIDIYPSHSLSDLQANRRLYAEIADFMQAKAKPRHIKVLYTGKVYHSIKTGRMLLPEAKVAGFLAAVFVLLLLIRHFYKQPQLILISALPIALPPVLTLALAYLVFGRINLFTLSLALLLPGHACQLIVHVFSRYFQERENNLSPKLCIESALLGIIPGVAASTLIMAAIFISFMMIPMPGLREFGILGAAGSLFNLIVCPLFSTALLQLAQRKKYFNVPKNVLHRTHKIKLFPNKVNWVIISVASVISLSGVFYSGNNLRFIYDFKQTEIQHNQTEVDSLVRETGFSTYDPIIVMLPDSSYNEDLMEDFERLQERGLIPDLHRIYTQYQFLPKITQSKQSKIDYLKKNLSPDVLSRMSPNDSAVIQKIINDADQSLKDFELSENIRRKFSAKDGTPGIFAFIIPSNDPDNGLVCRHISAQLQKFDGIQDKKFKICGTPVLRASILNMILANVDKSIVLGTILLWAILLLYYNKLSRAFFTMLPSMFAMSWITIAVHAFDIHLSAYSSLAYPLLIGASVDGAIQLWTSYYEKQNGTAWTVLQLKLSSILTAQCAVFIGSLALLFSSHPGIRGMGQLVFMGLVFILIAQLVIFPLIASTLDTYRINKKAKLKNDKAALH